MNPINAAQYGYQQFNRYKTWSQSHWVSRQLNRSFNEAIGFEYGNTGKARGFMGAKGWGSELRLAQKGTKSNYTKFAGKMAMRGAGGLFTAHSIISGFQEGGITGAAGGLATSMAWNIAMRAAVPLVMNPVGAIAIGTAAAGYAGYKFLQASQKNARDLKKTEMVDNGLLQASRNLGAVTTRQRSLQALQNTHINGRMAMGNEALMLHTSYR